MEPRFVYFFGGELTEGQAEMKNLLGGKGANLAEMASMGIPVPPGFTLTTEVCTYYYSHAKTLPDGLKEAVKESLKKMEGIMQARFGDPENPLLLSIRSGARASMPGMMDTVLNLGLNDTIVKGLGAKANMRFAYDSYRRFIQMYSDVVLGADSDKFEAIIDEIKQRRQVKLDTELAEADLAEMIVLFKAELKKQKEIDFPDDPWEQLWGGIMAVFNSWNTKRAIEYRRINNIPGDWGTAVNVQAMVFGNMGDDCATGVAFTRDPSTGENRFFGEYLVNAQGEDVVAGIRTPGPINIAGKVGTEASMEELFPKCYQELVAIYKKLEIRYKDMQDIEFTIQNHKLWMLQTRNGKRTAVSAIKMAVDMVREGLITQKEAVLRINPKQIDQVLHPSLDPKAKFEILAKGLPASPGAASGMVVFNAEDAVAWTKDKKKVILVRLETSAEDIHGMNVAEGILTGRGGMTSHAAVVGRGMGKTCVVGCGELIIDYEKEFFRVGSTLVKKGEVITLEGSRGIVIKGDVARVEQLMTNEYREFMTWVDKFRRLKVRTNADTPRDAKVARNFGAEGIGLCRTEHMFFDEERVYPFRMMILAADVKERQKAIEKILPMQRQDFAGIFKEMKGYPVTIRLLDPPLHEFLPKNDLEKERLAKLLKISVEDLEYKMESLEEVNPMLGHRGCRLGITFPEIYRMQVRAIIEAAIAVFKETGAAPIPEIMIPFVGDYEELRIIEEYSREIADELIKTAQINLPYLIGTMIEIPRAALTADKIAEVAEFFSFGTNDMTQMTWGLSRDDSGKFMPQYKENKIFEEDPFVTIDQVGVGQMLIMGIERGRKTKPSLKIGICGEHGGDPASVEFCHRIGLNYVSCSPYRVPIALVAAAQAALK